MRLVIIPIDVTFTPAGIGMQAIFVAAIWIGWGITLAAAEWWIRRTRYDAHGSLGRAISA